MFIILYFYRFNQIREDQAIVSCDSTNTIFTPGILLQEWRDFLLCLGEEVSRPELISARYSFVDPKVIVQLCQDTTIDMIHWMVYERFSSYKDIIPLFFWSDIQLLLKHKLAKQWVSKVVNQWVSEWVDSKNNKSKLNIPAHQLTSSPTYQTLHIFPSLFALTQFTHSLVHQLTNSLMLSWQTTVVQRAKYYRAIQSGQAQHIFATHSQIFRDWNNLQDIVLHDEYSSFYAVHAEPRYSVPKVVQYMKNISHYKL